MILFAKSKTRDIFAAPYPVPEAIVEILPPRNADVGDGVVDLHLRLPSTQPQDKPVVVAARVPEKDDAFWVKGAELEGGRGADGGWGRRIRKSCTQTQPSPMTSAHGWTKG